MAKFPDLNKDGKVTQADILMGRGVKLAKGGRIVYRDPGGKIGQDETNPIDEKHSQSTIQLNKERLKDVTDYGKNVKIRKGHINYIEDKMD